MLRVKQANPAWSEYQTIDNATICDLYGVANTGGIRVNNASNLIVLISNSTDPFYDNGWKDGVLHFVGTGSVGPQKLDRQNKTLARSKQNGMAVHLFEVFEKSKYVYAGEVELADEPYLSDQQDATDASRLVWMFPLRRKTTDPAETRASGQPKNHLPYGACAVIDGNLTDAQAELVHEALDRLKKAGVSIVDQRDIDVARYEKALAAWHGRVLDRVRAEVRALIAKRKKTAKERGREFRLIDDELKINSASDETELRAALMFLDRDDTTSANQIFDEAMSRETMPEPPKWLKQSSDPAEITVVRPSAIDRTKLKDFR